MTEAAPTLSVVIVTWNCSRFIGGCLTLLQASRGASRMETIVVDNASTDGTCEIVAREFPEVILVRCAENLGFARANNLAFYRARGRHVLLLNPDAMLTDPDAVAQMVARLDADPQVGMVGCRLVFEDGRHQVGDAGFRPSPFNMILHGLAIGHLLRGAPSFYLVRPDSYGTDVMDVDWVCGACVAVRRDLVEAAGGLDERMFLYAEDVEWGCRMRRHGSRVIYLPHVRVVHLGGQSESQAQGPVSVRWLDSLLRLYAEMNDGRWLATVRYAFMLGFAGRALVYWARAAQPARHDHFLRRRAELLAYARAAVALQHRAASPALGPVLQPEKRRFS